MDVYVARQPIFDRKKRVVAYELLFRGGMLNAMPDVDGDAATAKVLSTAFFNIGLDSLSARLPVSINFTQDLLEKEIPLLLPEGVSTIEVLPDVLPSEKVIECCKKIARADYHLLIDNITENDPREPLLQYADSVKIDVLNNDDEAVMRLVAQCRAAGKMLVAGKVESPDDFKRCVELEFDLFQGYFFSKPKVFTGSDLSASQLSLMQILTEVNKPEFDFEALEVMLTRDVATSYKLLRYMNSSLFKRHRQIKSVKHAMVLLGQAEIRRFLSLVVTSTLAGDKPDELMRNACLKARFGALIVGSRRGSCTAEEMFTTGLFSNIDAILDQSIHEVMGKLPLQQNIKDALLEGSGELGELLSLINAYLRGRWDLVAYHSEQLRVHEPSLHAFYEEACEWANELF